MNITKDMGIYGFAIIISSEHMGNTYRCTLYARRKEVVHRSFYSLEELNVASHLKLEILYKANRDKRFFP